MEELMHLLHQLLSRGKIKLDISVTVAHEDALKGETSKRGNFRAHCEICDFEGWYESGRASQNALTAKRQHCIRSGCPKHLQQDASKYQWIMEMHEGEENES